MPVRLPDADQDFIGPYNRLSASQVNTWKACPRLWYYEKVRRFVMPQIPILFVGRAVEEAICKTLKETPALIVEAAPADIYAETPLDANGRPDREYEQRWPAEQLLVLPESSGQWTSTRSNIGQITCSLSPCRLFGEHACEWFKHDRKAGDWDEDVDVERCAKMALNGIKMHMSEVRLSRIGI